MNDAWVWLFLAGTLLMDSIWCYYAVTNNKDYGFKYELGQLLEIPAMMILPICNWILISSLLEWLAYLIRINHPWYK